MNSMALLLVAGVFFLTALPAHAAPECLSARLYSTSWCGPCNKVKKDEAASIAALTNAKQLTSFDIDANKGGFVGDSLPELQVFDPKDEAKMLELFQGNPPPNLPTDLIIKDAPEIASRLKELAKQEACNAPPSGAPSSFDQLSARGISSPIMTSISNAVSWFFSFISSGFMAVFELFTGRVSAAVKTMV